MKVKLPFCSSSQHHRPVLRWRVSLQCGEGHVEQVFGGEDDQVAHLAAVGADLGRVLVGPVVEGDVVEGAVRAAVEQVEVPELEPQPLVGLPYELVRAEHILGIRPGVRGRHDLSHPLVVAVDREAAGVPLGTRHVRHRCAKCVAVWKRVEANARL